jgi:hypothetical protein
MVNRASSSNYNTMHGHIGYGALYNPALTTPQVLDPNTQLGQLGRSKYDEIAISPTED